MTSTYYIRDFLIKCELPLDRKNIDIYSFLQQYFLKFQRDFIHLLEHKEEESCYPKAIYTSLQDKQSKIFDLCDAILTTIQFYLDGRVLQSHSKLYSILDDMKSEFASCKIGQDTNFSSIRHELFRIRNVEHSSNFHAQDIFHIPFDEIYKVKAYRYSIAGYPCLYLATDKYLCWLECEEKPSFYYSKFVYQTSLQNSLLDFRYRPKEIIYKYHSYFLNQKLGKLEINKNELYLVTKIFVDYIATLPLLISCSIVNRQKDKSFYQDYIIPQILLSWIRENGEYDGVAYFSCSPNTEARKVGSYNLVFPPNREVGYRYCRKLLSMFKISTPNYCNITEYRNSHRNVESDDLVLFMIDDNDSSEEILNSYKEIRHEY